MFPDAALFSVVFGYTDILNDPVVLSNTGKYLNFNVANYLNLSIGKMSTGGEFWKIERRV